MSSIDASGAPEELKRAAPTLDRRLARPDVTYGGPADARDAEGDTIVEYNPFARDIQTNPYPVYRWLRDEAPVYHNPDIGFWALSRFDDVLGAHLDPATFVSGHGVTIEGYDQGNDVLISRDEPSHSWHRKLVRASSRLAPSPTSSPRCVRSRPASSTTPATGVRSTSWPSSPPTCR